MRTSISKKLLAGALSVMMVLSLVAPTGVQAAAKKQPTAATKITISKGNFSKVAGKTSGAITVKLNAKTTGKVTVNVKSNKTSVAKVTKSTVTIKKNAKKNTKSTSFKVKALKAGKATITASFKNSKGKTVKKSITVTVKAKAATKVAVTGVSLSNTTPKVGDVITANVAPADATDVTYQWYTGETASLTTAIAGATSKDFTVTKEQLGKFVGIVLTDGTNNQTFSAVSTVAVQEQVTEALAIKEAKQTGAKTADITFNKAPGTVTIVVSKDNKAVSQEVLATKENVISLQFGSNLVKGEYIVKVTDAEKKECTGTFTAEDAVLTKVDFVNKNLMVTSNTTDGMKKAYAVLTSEDQWGNHMNLSGATFTVSKESSHSFNADSGVLTVNAPTATGTTTYANANYTIGETVVVTVQYNQGQTPKVITGILTVSLADSVKTLTFGDLTTDNATYKSGTTTQEALTNGDYYFPVTEATSEAGIKLDTDMLNSMVQSTDNPGGTLFVTPNASTRASAYVYANGFVDKKINGVTTPCLSIKAGVNISQLNIDLDYQITVVSQSGLNQSLTIPIKRNAVVKTVEVANIPAMYAGKYVEIPLKATATDGKSFDLYDKLTVGNTYAAAATNTSEVTAATVYVRINDEKAPSSTDTNFTITSTGGLSAKVVVDTSKKTSTLFICPAAKGYMTITGTTAGFGAVNYANITVNEVRGATGIQGLYGISTNLLDTADDQPFTTKNVIFTGDDSEAIAPADAAYPIYSPVLLNTGNDLKDSTGTTADDAAKNIINKATDGAAAMTAPLAFATVTEGTLPATPDSVKYVWSARLMSVDATLNTNTYTGAGIALDKTTKKISVVGGSGDSNTLRIYLYKVVCKTATTWDVSEVTHKDFEFDVISEQDASYKLAIDKENNVEPKLYSGKKNADSIGVTLTTTTGAKVDQKKLASGSISFTIDGKNTDAFKYSNGTIMMAKALGTTGKAKMTATFATEISKTATAEVEFEYTNETPYAIAGGLYNTSTYAKFDGSEVYAGATGLVDSVTSAKAGGYQVIVFDQYMNNILTDWSASAANDPVNVKVTSKGTAADIAGAAYTAEGVQIYGDTSMTAGTATVVITSGAITKTFYVGITAADSYPADEEATLASIEANGSATSFKWNDSTTGVTLQGVDSNGIELGTSSDLTLIGITKSGSNAAMAGKFNFATAGGKLVANTGANAPTPGSYTATFISASRSGTATYEFTVAKESVALNSTTLADIKIETGITASSGNTILTTTDNKSAANIPGTYKLYQGTVAGANATEDEIEAATLIGSKTLGLAATNAVIAFDTDAAITSNPGTGTYFVVFEPSSDFYTGSGLTVFTAGKSASIGISSWS